MLVLVVFNRRPWRSRPAGLPWKQRWLVVFEMERRLETFRLKGAVIAQFVAIEIWVEAVARWRNEIIVDLARQRRLPADATGGSIATVTNFGTFGLTWATPIPLPEQTLVLGMGAGKQVPSWDPAKGQFVPVMEANLTLSFDHRVLDGGGAGRLLARIAALLAKPEKL